MKNALLWLWRNIFLRLFGLIVMLVVLPFLFIDYLGLLFAVSMIAAGVAWLGFGVGTAAAYFSVGWKVYVGLGIFTFVFLMTFLYKNCCEGMQSFRVHLKHRGLRGVGEDFLSSLIWPWRWFQFRRFLKGSDVCLADLFHDATKYWFVNIWRGTALTNVNFQTGEITTIYVKTPKDARDAIRDVIEGDFIEKK